MPAARYNLAIETTTSRGQIALGHDDALIEARHLPPQRRHNVGLVPGIDQLCREHRVTPRDLARIAVSLGPGSFTGLRVAIAAAKMLALAGEAQLVGVPTLDVIAQDAPPAQGRVGVCLNHKHDSVYCAIYRREGERMVRVTEPAVRTLEEFRTQDPPPTTLIGDVPPQRAAPRVEVVWQLGRERARGGDIVDAFALEPVYGRRPEAVELWERTRGAEAAT